MSFKGRNRSSALFIQGVFAVWSWLFNVNDPNPLAPGLVPGRCFSVLLLKCVESGSQRGAEAMRGGDVQGAPQMMEQELLLEALALSW